MYIKTGTRKSMNRRQDIKTVLCSCTMEYHRAAKMSDHSESHSRVKEIVKKFLKNIYLTII